MKRAQARRAYYRRIFSAYLTKSQSQLTFWHEVPAVNENLQVDEMGEYYMSFTAKADFPGHYDDAGIPMLDYRGEVGLRYNPIAIAQYSLGNFNLFRQSGADERRANFLRAADWLVGNLERNPKGIWVWNHHFDWEYRDLLRSPWYSALAQGQAISALLRAHAETDDEKYMDAARKGFESFLVDVSDGGVTYTDSHGHIWFEETIVDPPTHILNGFLWASWGIWDYWLHTQDERAKRLFDEAVRTLESHLNDFDAGFWSLYEQSGKRMRMLASGFYHHLHVIQLRVTHRLTANPIFLSKAETWQRYRESSWRRKLALTHKSIFKLVYY